MNARVFHAHLWGTRERKYRQLLDTDISTTRWTELAPQSPFYLFTPQDVELQSEYEKGWRITDIFPVHSVGIVTARDHLTIRWSAEEVWQVVRDFARLPPEKARDKYDLGRDVQDWAVKDAQADLRQSGPHQGDVVSILYRPFDRRFTYYTGRSRGFICRPRPEVMKQMLTGQNAGLHVCRQIVSQQWRHVLITSAITDDCYVSNKTRERGYTFPLYLYPDPEKDGELFPDGAARHANLNPKLIGDVARRLGLTFIGDGCGDLRNTFGPDDVLHYVYAVLHSPGYRERYAQFLRIDFPRVPLTSDRTLFRMLCKLGRELVALHLLESPKLSRLMTRYPVPGADRVERGHPKYLAPGEPEPGTGKPVKRGRVYISSDRPKEGKKGQYIEGVSPRTWQFYIGGYQVCEKWLRDRRGRSLSYDDLTHYQKIVLAAHETIRLMDQIDAAIVDWPIR